MNRRRRLRLRNVVAGYCAEKQAIRLRRMPMFFRASSKWQRNQRFLPFRELPVTGIRGNLVPG
ncbi:MAG: hypothetical protein AMS27_00180 [Bacteroides sp. SM23_62_1]|nr:MAG: hypothetical protein AMS27_00180 [Bacteroides sp. SM23_62_1]